MAPVKKTLSHGKPRPTFNIHWCDKLLFPDWYPWLQPDEDDNSKGRCACCEKAFCLSINPWVAIANHAKGAKHKMKLQLYKLKYKSPKKPKSNTVKDAIPSTSHAASATPEAISATPESLSATPEALSATPEGIFETPEALSATPEEIFETPEGIFETPEGIFDSPEATIASPEAKFFGLNPPEAPKKFSSTLEPIYATPEDTFEVLEAIPCSQDVPEARETMPSYPEAISSALTELYAAPEDVAAFLKTICYNLKPSEAQNGTSSVPEETFPVVQLDPGTTLPDTKADWPQDVIFYIPEEMLLKPETNISDQGTTHVFPEATYSGFQPCFTPDELFPILNDIPEPPETPFSVPKAPTKDQTAAKSKDVSTSKRKLSDLAEEGDAKRFKGNYATTHEIER